MAPALFNILSSNAVRGGLFVLFLLNVVVLFRIVMLETTISQTRCPPQTTELSDGPVLEVQPPIPAAIPLVQGADNIEFRRGSNPQHRRVVKPRKTTGLSYEDLSNLEASQPAAHMCRSRPSSVKASRCSARVPGPVFAAVTTTPKRLISKSFKSRIQTLLNQTFPLTALIVAVPYVSAKAGMPYPPLPNSLLEVSKGDIPIVFVRGVDYGPATKLLLPLSYLASSTACDDATIIVADDDVFYHPELACKYIEHSILYPKAALTVRGKKIRDPCIPRYNETINFMHDRLWKENPLDENFTRPTSVQLMTGVGTYLVKSKFFDQELFNYASCDTEIFKRAFVTDDIWISGHLARQGIERIAIPLESLRPGPYNAFPRPIDGLWQLYNQGTSNNDVIMELFSNKFGCHNKPQSSACDFGHDSIPLIGGDHPQSWVLPTVSRKSDGKRRLFMVIASDTSADLDGEVQGEFIWICNLARMLLSNPDTEVHFFPVYKRLTKKMDRFSLFPDDPRLKIILPQSSTPVDLFDGFTGQIRFNKANSRGHVLLENNCFAALLSHLMQHNSYSTVLVRHSSYSTYTRNLMLTSPNILRNFWFMTHGRTDDFAISDIKTYGSTVMFQSELMFPKRQFRPLVDGVHRREVWVPPMIDESEIVSTSRPQLAGRFRLCYLGAFNYDEKDTYLISAMIKGFTQLYSRLPNAELLMVMSGLHRMNSGMKDLLTSFPGIEVRGAVDHEEAIRLYTHECDIGIRGLLTDVDRPDKSKMVATKIVEMSSLALPIVLNPSEINRHLLPEDYPLFWSEDNPVDSFAEVIEHVYRNPKLYVKASQQVHELAKSFTFQATYNRLLPAIDNTARWAAVASNMSKSRFSVVIRVEKIKKVKSIVRMYAASPWVHAVYLVWNAPRKQGEVLMKELYNSHLAHRVVFLFQTQSAPVPVNRILTEAVFLADENVNIHPDLLERGFWTWQDNKKVLVGYRGGMCTRVRGPDAFVLEPDCFSTGRCNIVRANAAFVHQSYLKGRSDWDDGISLNFQIAKKTGLASVLLPPLETDVARGNHECEMCSKPCIMGLEEYGSKLQKLICSAEYFVNGTGNDDGPVR